jgi:hypothetical protein
MAANMYDQAA